MTRDEFFRKYLHLAKAVTNGTPIFPAVVLSVAAHESDNGNSQLTKQANNYFGLKKGSSWTGETIPMKTGEYITDPLTGKKVYVMVAGEEFRKYPSAEAGFKDYVHVVSKYRIYSEVPKQTTAFAQLEEIAKAGYATDPGYVAKVSRAMDTLKSWIDTVKKKALSELGEQHYCFWGASMPLIA